MAKDASVTVRIPSELKAQLDAAAAADHRSTSSLVTAILHRWANGDAPTDAQIVGKRVGRPRSETTRTQSLEAAAHLLPWLKPLVAGFGAVTISDILQRGLHPGSSPPAPGIEKAIAHALHGLGWSETGETSGDGTHNRVWRRD